MPRAVVKSSLMLFRSLILVFDFLSFVFFVSFVNYRLIAVGRIFRLRFFRISFEVLRRLHFLLCLFTFVFLLFSDLPFTTNLPRLFRSLLQARHRSETWAWFRPDKIVANVVKQNQCRNRSSVSFRHWRTTSPEIKLRRLRFRPERAFAPDFTVKSIRDFSSAAGRNFELFFAETIFTSVSLAFSTVKRLLRFSSDFSYQLNFLHSFRFIRQSRARDRKDLWLRLSRFRQPEIRAVSLRRDVKAKKIIKKAENFHKS